MAQIGSCWVQTSWNVDAWVADSWANGVIPPAPSNDEPALGGRRIYDPDDKKQRVKTRRLRKKEREDLDKMFREHARPRYVTPEPETPKPTKRETPYVPPVVESPRTPDRVVAAKQFLALDALDEWIAERERESNENARAVEVAHIRAKQHARWLEAEQQRIAREAIAAESARVEAIRLAEVQRLADEEAFRLAEIERIAAEEEAEMLDVLMWVHNNV